VDGAVEFNLLHCIAGVALAVGCGFLVDYWARRVRRTPTPESIRPNVQVEEPSVVSGNAVVTIR
jgi:hypothetical protein